MGRIALTEHAKRFVPDAQRSAMFVGAAGYHQFHARDRPFGWQRLESKDVRDLAFLDERDGRRRDRCRRGGSTNEKAEERVRATDRKLDRARKRFEAVVALTGRGVRLAKAGPSKWSRSFTPFPDDSTGMSWF